MFGKISKFFKQVKGEMKKVHWPNKDELSSYTMVVVITVAAMIAFIGVIDLIFSNIITPLIM
ncbi:MAG: preprotein translocase subunit SecE [Bacillota bacterium]